MAGGKTAFRSESWLPRAPRPAGLWPGPRQQRCDAPYGDAAVLPLGLLRVDLQELLAVSLGDEILGRYIELLGEDGGDLLGPAIRQEHVVLLGADGIRVTLDQDDLLGVALEQPVDGLSDPL